MPLFPNSITPSDLPSSYDVAEGLGSSTWLPGSGWTGSTRFDETVAVYSKFVADGILALT